MLSFEMRDPLIIPILQIFLLNSFQFKVLFCSDESTVLDANKLHNFDISFSIPCNLSIVEWQTIVTVPYFSTEKGRGQVQEYWTWRPSSAIELQGSKVVSRTFMDRHFTHKIHVILDNYLLNCQEAIVGGIINSSTSYYRFQGGSPERATVLFVNQSDFNVDVDLSFLKRFEIGANFYIFNLNDSKLYECYFIKDLKIIQEVGNGMDLDYLVLTKASRRTNFYGLPLIGNTPNDKYFSEIVRTGIRNGEVVFEDGIGVNIYRELAYMLNFSEKAILGDWLSFNGTLFGETLSQLNSGQADISIAQLTMLPFRADGVQYLHSIVPYWVAAYFVQPASSSLKNVFLVPFSNNLWIGYFIGWISIVISIILITNRYKIRPLWDSEFGLWVIGTICQQGSQYGPASFGQTPLRITVSIGFLVSMLIFIAYSANLMSILTTPRVPVNNFMDLLREKFTLMVQKDSNAVNVIVKNLLHVYGYQNLELRQIETEEEFRIFSHKSAILYFPDSFYPVMRDNMTDTMICQRVSSVSVGSFPLKSGMFIKKGSPYKEVLNLQVLRLLQQGVISRQIKMYKKKTETMCGNLQKGFFGSNLVDLFTAFVFLVVGLLFSLVFYVIEECGHKMSKPSHTKRGCNKAGFFTIRLIPPQSKPFKQMYHGQKLK